MAEKWKDRLTDQLCKATLSLETVDDVYRFLEDIATIGEIRALAQRLEVAKLFKRRVHLSSDRPADRGQHCHHKQGEEVSGIRRRRLQTGS